MRVAVVMLLDGRAVVSRSADCTGLDSLTTQNFKTDDGRQLSVGITDGYLPVAIDLLAHEAVRERQAGPPLPGEKPNPGPVKRI